MTEAPTTQERYSRAVRSSSLRVEGEFVRGDADMLIAAGWCKSKFGAALMRLQAEWDGAERWGIKHPIKPTKRAIMVEAQVKFSMSAKVMKGKERPVVITKITKDSMEAARTKLEQRYQSELQRAVSALKSLPEVALHLQIGLALDGEDAELAAPILLYWLDPNCKVCHGTGLQSKSERGCGKCREHPGLATVPGGDAGKATLKFLNDCFSRAGGEVRLACRS